LSTQAANQPIRLFSTVDGPGDLTLSSGTQDITFDASIGSTVPLGALTIVTVGNFTAKDVVNAASIAQNAGTGLSLFDADVNTSGFSGISLTGAQFTFLGNVTTTGGGSIAITNSSTLTTTVGKTFTSDGAFTQNGTGAVLLASNITTTNAIPANAAINFSGSSPITLVAPVSIDSSTGGGDIDFAAASTIDGNQSIAFSAGTGNIHLLGALGGTTPLATVAITSAHDVQLAAITAGAIAQSAGTGTTTLLAPISTNTPTGILFVCNNFTTGPLAGSVTTTN